MTNEEILLIDKPSGMSSFDVIRALRREAREVGEDIPKMGHAGTLDPLATGLMIIGAGKGTKRMEEFLKLPKTYDVVARIGEQRDTGDLEGEVFEQQDVETLDETVVRNTLSEMVGDLELPVPAYSAIKRDGKKLYELARKGGEVEVPIRTMHMRDLTFDSIACSNNRCDVSFSADVASGVYIRSLVEELGRRLGYPATTASLRRTIIGDMSVKDARPIENKPRTRE